jgi:hypothetical protein
MCYLYYAIQLDGRRKDIMEAISRGMQDHSTPTIGPHCIRKIGMEE